MKTVMSELNIEVVALVDMSRSFSQVDFSHTGEGSNLFEFRLKKKKPRQSTDRYHEGGVGREWAVLE